MPADSTGAPQGPWVGTMFTTCHPAQGPPQTCWSAQRSATYAGIDYQGFPEITHFGLRFRISIRASFLPKVGLTAREAISRRSAVESGTGSSRSIRVVRIHIGHTPRNQPRDRSLLTAILSTEPSLVRIRSDIGRIELHPTDSNADCEIDGPEKRRLAVHRCVPCRPHLAAPILRPDQRKLLEWPPWALMIGRRSVMSAGLCRN